MKGFLIYVPLDCSPFHYEQVFGQTATDLRTCNEH